MIYALKAVAGQERVVADMFYSEAAHTDGIYCVLYTTGLRGYILVEADNDKIIEETAKKIPKTKGLAGKPPKRSISKRAKGTDQVFKIKTITIEELENTLFPKKVIIRLKKGDLVEVVSGAFKGEKARVIRINKEKDEVTIELTEVAVPIPITVRGNNLRAIKEE